MAYRKVRSIHLQTGRFNVGALLEAVEECVDETLERLRERHNKKSQKVKNDDDHDEGKHNNNNHNDNESPPSFQTRLEHVRRSCRTGQAQHGSGGGSPIARASFAT